MSRARPVIHAARQALDHVSRHAEDRRTRPRTRRHRVRMLRTWPDSPGLGPQGAANFRQRRTFVKGQPPLSQLTRASTGLTDRVSMRHFKRSGRAKLTPQEGRLASNPTVTSLPGHPSFSVIRAFSSGVAKFWPGELSRNLVRRLLRSTSQGRMINLSFSR